MGGIMCCAVEERTKNDNIKRNVEKPPTTVGQPQLQNKPKKEEDPELELSKLLEKDGYQPIRLNVQQHVPASLEMDVASKSQRASESGPLQIEEEMTIVCTLVKEAPFDEQTKSATEPVKKTQEISLEKVDSVAIPDAKFEAPASNAPVVAETESTEPAKETTVPNAITTDGIKVDGGTERKSQPILLDLNVDVTESTEPVESAENSEKEEVEAAKGGKNKKKNKK